MIKIKLENWKHVNLKFSEEKVDFHGFMKPEGNRPRLSTEAGKWWTPWARMKETGIAQRKGGFTLSLQHGNDIYKVYAHSFHTGAVKQNKTNVLSNLTVSCWVTFIAALNHMWVHDFQFDIPGTGAVYSPKMIRRGKEKKTSLCLQTLNSLNLILWAMKNKNKFQSKGVKQFLFSWIKF